MSWPWQALPRNEMTENYKRIQEVFVADYKMLRLAEATLDWESATFVSVREIKEGGEGNSAALSSRGVEIELAFGYDGEMRRRLITGFLKLEGDKWVCLSRCPAGILK